LLGCFLFSGDDADKKIRILSGGEKARVALAKTIISKANFLMLDEPTNHLDMHSCDLLIEALNKYEGTIILVSHDRYFVSKTANKIWEIVDHRVKEFKGGYDEWVAWNERMADKLKRADKANESTKSNKSVKSDNSNEIKEVTGTKKPVESNGSNKPVDSFKVPEKQGPTNKEVKKELQKQQRNFQQVEDKIGKLKVQLSEMEASLVDPAIYSDKQKFIQVENDYKRLTDDLARLNKEYEKIFDTIILLEQDVNK